MNISQQSGLCGYLKPEVRDRGRLESVTHVGATGDELEAYSYTLLWPDLPAFPSDDPLPIGSQETR